MISSPKPSRDNLQGHAWLAIKSDLQVMQTLWLARAHECDAFREAYAQVSGQVEASAAGLLTGHGVPYGKSDCEDLAREWDCQMLANGFERAWPALVHVLAYTILRRLVIKWVRKRRRDAGQPPEQLDMAEKVCERLDRLCEMIRDEVEALPTEEENAIRQRYLKEMTVHEIAAAEGLSCYAVYSRIHSGMDLLEVALQELIRD